jgi:GAF domain-containing protein
MIRTISGDEFARLRARFVQVLAWGSIIVAGLTLVAPIAASPQQEDLIRSIATSVVLIVFSGLCLVLLRRGQQESAQIALIAAFTIASLIATTPAFLVATMALLTAATLGNSPIFVVATLLVLGKLGVEMVIAITGRPLTPDLYAAILPVISLAIMSAVVRYFVNAAQRSMESNRRTATLLQVTADVDKIIARLLDMNEVLNQTVSLLRTRFSYEHVQVYLVGEGENAVLTAAASAAGRELLNRGYRVPLGSRSSVGQVMLTGRSTLINYRSSETFKGEDVFEDTQSQLALPLRDGERVIGVLDLQSLEADAISPTDAPVLQVMADLLATSVRNARQYQAQAHIAEENKRLYEQSENNRREIERLNQELTRSSWQEYMRSIERVPGVTLADNQLIPDAGWTDALAQAQQERRPVNRVDGEQPVVAVPITLRGEVIGAIEVEPGAEASDLDAVEMVEAVAQRLAISLESARLYEETQKAAAHEQRINDIAARYQQVTTVDELLRITLQELSDSLGAQRGVIRLGNIQEVSA